MYSANEGLYGQGYDLPSGHIQFWELDHEEGRMSKNWCLQTMVLEKIPESPLDGKEIKPVNVKGNQSWTLIGRTDAEVEAPVFWSRTADCFDMNSRLTGKLPDAAKEWGQEKGMSEDEMAKWHHQCNGHKLGETLGNGKEQGGLACCSPWGHRELDVTEQLNNITYIHIHM